MVLIPDITQLHHLEENLSAANIQLTTNVLREIDAAAAKIEIQEKRLPAAMLNMIESYCSALVSSKSRVSSALLCPDG
jgi:hypothetical protein